jgi:sulfur-oxidizing protein SoxY
VPIARRVLLCRASWAARGLAVSGLWSRPGFAAPDAANAADPSAEDQAWIMRQTGRAATMSDRVHLDMPAVFGNGYSVPMTLSVDSPMSEADHVRSVELFAPQNPIVAVARFHFTPASGRASVTTRIRLAKPQAVLAVAEMSDGSRLMARRWVKVDTNGCA